MDVVAKCLPDCMDCYTDWPTNTLTERLGSNEPPRYDRIDYAYFAPAIAPENRLLTLDDAAVEVPKGWKIDDGQEMLDLSDHNPVLSG